jgi:hypothetical protein
VVRRDHLKPAAEVTQTVIIVEAAPGDPPPPPYYGFVICA